VNRIDLYTSLLGGLQYQSVAGRTRADQLAISARPSDPPGPNLETPFFEIFDRDETGRELIPTDVLALSSGYLAFRPDDIDKISPEVSQYGEFLPIDTSQGPRLYFRPSNYLSGLDPEESGVKYSADGKRIIWLPRTVITNELVESIGVFKLDQVERGPVLYRSDIVENMRRTGLFTGIEFKLHGWANTRP
jgi:hypothetical protein